MEPSKKIGQQELLETAEASNAVSSIAQWAATQLAKYLQALQVAHQVEVSLQQQVAMLSAQCDKSKRTIEDLKASLAAMQERAIRFEEDLHTAKINVNALQRQLDNDRRDGVSGYMHTLPSISI